MRLKTLVAAAGAALAVCSFAAVAGPGDSKLRADLPQVLADAQQGELVPVTIIMAEQAEAFELTALRAMSKEDRRQFVINELKQVAGATQGGVLDLLSQAQQNGQADQISPLWISNVIAARVSPDVALQIADRDDVAYLNYDRPIGQEVFPTEPAPKLGDAGGITAAVECGTALMNAPTAWSNGYNGSGITVAVIDTGTCISHPDIQNRLWTNAGEIPGNNQDDDGNGFVDDIHGWSFDGGGSSSNINDNNGHGSHTAGTVAGDGTQGTECGTAPGARVQTVKFWNSLSGESAAWNCMQYTLDNGADLTSNSYGWAHSWSPDRVTWRTISENQFAAGLVLVFAAGNEGGGTTFDNVRTPGDVPDMITVGATDCNMNAASFSSRGPVTWQSIPPFSDWAYPPGKLKPTISAPGVSTTSHNLCNGYVQFSGTSMATPHVAGAVALMLQANPNLDHYEVKQILKDIAIDRGASGPDNTYGHGFVDAWAAVQAALDAGCVADFNGDGAVNTNDVLAFLNAWNDGDPRADINGDGNINTNDVLAFLNLWNAGC
ncbi:MAG: S8 family serine peptidase [Phycisphaerales bacterium JB054]